MPYPRHEPRPLPSYPPGQPGAGLPARPPRPPRPPLTKRMRPGHWIAVDYAVGALAALTGLLAMAQSLPSALAELPARLVVAAAIFFPIALRRRRPVPAFCALVILGVLAVFTGTGPAGSSLVFLAAAYVLYTVTVTGNKQTGVAALTFALSVITAVVLLVRAHQIPANRGNSVDVVVAFALIISWMTGYSVRQRRLYAQMLQHEAASSAVAEERLRIARELHDVVAHSMSVIAVQAGYGQYVIDDNPGDAREALGAIQATSRDALEEMRRMLGVLRQQDASPGFGPDAAAAGGAGAGTGAGTAARRAGGGPGGGGGAGGRAGAAPLAPAPGLADLGRLVERTCGAGVHVVIERSGFIRAVPAGVDLSAYRIIQEALTNVVKHAGSGARCTVRLGYGEDALEIRVTDDGGQSLVLSPAGVSAGTGHGIIGMRERANLCGGEFSARPLAPGGYEVRAVLPLLSGPAGNGDSPAGTGGVS
jgi:signal transduction histidine kinase